MPTSHILARIIVRTGAAVWRQRVTWLIAAAAVTALGAFRIVSAGPSVINGDCADTTMVAFTSMTDSSARAAYACLNPGLRSTTEDSWVAGLRQRGVPHGQFNRIADTRTNDGGQIVFYAVHRQGESLGFIVYLDPQGRVRGVE